MEDEKLIETVRKYEFIYNLKHPKYMDTVKKDIAWKEIGKQVKQPAIACKQRWQCLRDAYRRALNKKKRKSGQAAKNIKPWKYENEMAFVAPFFMERKTHSSLEITSDDELSDNADENYATEFTVLEKPNIKTEDTSANNGDVDVNTNNSATKSKEEEAFESESKKPKAVKRKAVQSEPSAPAILMAKSLDDEKTFEPLREHEELDRFFLNISDTVKKFSPYLRALAKNKIFSLVSEMEIQMLAPSSSTLHTFLASPQSASTSAAPTQTSPDNWSEQTRQPMSTNSENSGTTLFTQKYT